MDIFLAILSMMAFAVVTLVVYNVLKAYVLDKVKINKWIVLAVAVVLFVGPMVLWPDMPGYVSNYIIPGVVVIFLLWFMDLLGFMKGRKFFNRKPTSNGSSSTSSKKDKKNDVVIRPKAKPNRVKNNINNNNNKFNKK